MKECKSCGATWEKGNVCPYCHRHVIIENPPCIPVQSNSPKKHNHCKKIFVCALIGFVSVMFANSARNFIYNYSALNAESHYEESCSDKYISYSLESEKNQKIEYQREKGIYTSGKYEAGRDIPEGEYIICSDGMSPGKNFYMGIYVSSSCSDESRISGGWYQGNTIAVLEKGQFVEVSHGIIYDRKKSGIVLSPFSESGMFKTGTDIPAGTYQLEKSDLQYTASYKIYSSLNSVAPVVKYSGFLDDNKNITVSLQEGEYIQTVFCHIKEN